jgi:DNA-binding MarR family transcriptional regulator
MKRSKKVETNCAISDAGKLHPQLTTYVGYCLHKVALRMRASIDSRLKEYGLVAPQFGMMLLLKFDGAMTQVELGSYTAIDKATMVRLLDSLEEIGYVKRSQHQKDRRAKMIELTEPGRKAIASMEKLRAQAEKEFLEPLTAEERSRLKEIITKLVLA